MTDPAAGLSRLFEEQRDTLNRYFLRRTAHAWDAQDLVQEVYLRLLRADRHGAQDIRNPEAYLFTIASNLLRDRWRARREEQWPENFEQQHSADLHRSGIDAQLDIRRIMQALKPKERLLLWLAYVEGMTHTEIAAATGLAAISIRPMLFRARKKAAALLQPESKCPEGKRPEGKCR